MKKWFFLLFFLFSPAVASAFSLSPAKVDLTIDPGDIQIVEVKIKNNDKTEKSFRPIVMGVEQTEQGTPRFVSGVSEIESWADSKTQTFVLLPGQERNIQFSIDIPNGSYPGSYFLGLGAEQLGGQNGNVNLSGRLLSLVNIKVAGIVSEELGFDKWQSVKKIWFSPDWKFVSTMINKGNVELPLRGELVIYDFRGRKIAGQELYLGNKLIPGTARDLDFSFSLPGKYLFVPGIYQTDLVLHYGMTNQKMVLSTKLWYFYPPTIFLLMVLIFLPVLFFLTKKLFFSRRK
jgi:hypothetical protein